MRKAAQSILVAGALAAVVAPVEAQAQDTNSAQSANFFFGRGLVDYLLGWGHGGNDNDYDRPNRPNRRDSVPALRGTKCWKFQAAFGKPAFIELHFFNRRHGHSLVSGQVVRADGVNKKPDRVLQVSGSAGYNTYTSTQQVPKLDENNQPVVDEAGNPVLETVEGPEVERFLMDLTYSFSKTGTDFSKAFTEASLHTRGHYAVRLDAETLDGVFAGNDFILRWAPPLTGPLRTLPNDSNAAPGNGVTANYMGGLDCTGGSCGLILPLNNAGTFQLVGRNKRQCDNARQDFGPDF